MVGGSLGVVVSVVRGHIRELSVRGHGGGRENCFDPFSRERMALSSLQYQGLSTRHPLLLSGT